MSQDFELAAASPSDDLDVLAMLHEIGPGENGFMNHAHNLSEEAWPAYLVSLAEQAAGQGLAPGRVQNTVYWLRRDGYPVAMSKLRHALNDNLMVYGGHVGYSVRPSERGRGYGYVLLQKTLEKAQELKLTRLLIIPQRSNARSHAMIERQGGILEPNDDPEYLRYWIDLTSA